MLAVHIVLSIWESLPQLGSNCDPLFRRSVRAAGQPACTQLSRCIKLSGSDREFPALTGRSGTQRARRPLRPELAAPLGVWPSSQLAMDVVAAWDCGCAG
jgi:hypothetical protein